MYTLRTENDGMFLYAVKDGKTEVDFTDEYAVTAFLNEVNDLTAENAKLRERLAEAVELLRNVRNANSVTRIIMDYDDIDALLKKVKLQ